MKKIVVLLVFLSITTTFAQKIPNLDLKSLDGKTININSISRTDDIKVFSFWATWCVPCINELDAISEVYQDWQDETNVELIAVSTDDARTKKRVRPMVNGKGWDYTVLLDENQDFKRALNISAIPHVIVVKNGEIIYRHSGYTPGSEEELLKIIKENL